MILELKNVGANMNVEKVLIYHIATDGDGNLKIKQSEEFRDSKAYSEAFGALKATIPNQS
jgi:hypothetical protein